MSDFVNKDTGAAAVEVEINSSLRPGQIGCYTSDGQLLSIVDRSVLKDLGSFPKGTSIIHLSMSDYEDWCVYQQKHNIEEIEIIRKQ